jgi:two-component system response regulator PhoP
VTVGEWGAILKSDGASEAAIPWLLRIAPRFGMRVLVVEDEKRLAENIASGLRQVAGYAVDISLDGEDGLFMATTNDYDLLVLDLMLPKLPGPTVLEKYRQSGRDTPVLILTARDETQSIIKLLNAGADDYLSKPFDFGEMLARAKALVRRGKGKAQPLLTIDDLEIGLADRIVEKGGRRIDLAPMEYRVLEYLASRSPAVVSKTELLEHLYDYNWEKFSNVIEVYISGLRKKIDGSSRSKLIHTLRGHGYVLRSQSSAKLQQ